MRTTIVVAAVAASVFGAITTPASADKPARGCPDGFRPVTSLSSS